MLILQAAMDAEDSPVFWNRVGIRDEMLDPFAGMAGGILYAHTHSDYESRLLQHLDKLTLLRGRAKEQAAESQGMVEDRAEQLAREVNQRILVPLPRSVLDARQRPVAARASATTSEGLPDGSAAGSTDLSKSGSLLAALQEHAGGHGADPSTNPQYSGGRPEAIAMVEASRYNPWHREGTRKNRRSSLAMVPFAAAQPSERDEGPEHVVEPDRLTRNGGTGPDHSRFLRWHVDRYAGAGAAGAGAGDDDMHDEEAEAEDSPPVFSRTGAVMTWAGDGTTVDLEGFKRYLEPLVAPWRLRSVQAPLSHASSSALGRGPAGSAEGGAGANDDEKIAFGFKDLVITAGLAESVAMAVQQSAVSASDPTECYFPISGTGLVSQSQDEKAHGRGGAATGGGESSLDIAALMQQAQAQAIRAQERPGSSGSTGSPGDTDPSTDPIVLWAKPALSAEEAISSLSIGPNPRGCSTEAERGAAVSTAKARVRFAGHPVVCRCRALWLSPGPLQPGKGSQEKEENGEVPARATSASSHFSTVHESGGRPIRGLRILDGRASAQQIDLFQTFEFRKVHGSLELKTRPRAQLWLSFDAGCPDVPSTAGSMRAAARRWEGVLLGAAFMQARAELLLLKRSSDLATLSQAKALRARARAMHGRLLALAGHGGEGPPEGELRAASSAM